MTAVTNRHEADGHGWLFLERQSSTGKRKCCPLMNRYTPTASVINRANNGGIGRVLTDNFNAAPKTRGLNRRTACQKTTSPITCALSLRPCVQIQTSFC